MPKSKEKPFNFEVALDELNDIVEKMEEGDLTLEDSLIQFETGIKLAHDCQTALTHAEQKVKILLEQDNSQTLEDYEDNTDV